MPNPLKKPPTSAINPKPSAVPKNGEHNQSTQKESMATKIDRLITFCTQPRNYKKIKEWRQKKEDERAEKEKRPPKEITTKTANRDFGRALRSERSPLNNSARKLAREFLPQLPLVAYYEKRNGLPALDTGHESSFEVHAVRQHFAAQEKNKKEQALASKPSQQKNRLKQQAECFDNLADALVGAANQMRVENIITVPCKDPTLLSDNPALILKANHPAVTSYNDYAQLMKKAAKLGLGCDPYIREWHIYHGHQSESKGLSSKPIPEHELRLYNVIDDMWDQGYGWHQMHKELISQGIMKKKNWSAFYSWIKRRGFLTTYVRVNKKL